jgi:hypothetical protein
MNAAARFPSELPAERVASVILLQSGRFEGRFASFSKTVVGATPYRGFESLPLRWQVGMPWRENGSQGAGFRRS